MTSGKYLIFTLITLTWACANNKVGTQQPQAENIFLDETPASFVAPKKVKLTEYQLEEVPDTWQTAGTLATTNEIRRAGYKGIKWEWKGSDPLKMDLSKHLETLMIDAYMKVAFGGGIGLSFWVYNEKARPNEKLTMSLAANGYEKQFEFGLNYSGWRACTIQFAEMPDGGNAPDGMLIIKPPVSAGSIVLDRLEIGNLTAHTMADYQLPYSENDNHWVHQYAWEKAGKPKVAGSPTEQDKAAWNRIVQNIERKSLGWSLHVDEWISDEERKLITSGDRSDQAAALAIRIRELARKNYDDLGLSVQIPNIIAPYSRTNSPYSNEVTWRHLEENVFPMVALDYLNYQDEEAKTRFITLLDWFESQGVTAGHSYTSTSHIGYRSRNLSMGLFLCRDLLKQTDREEKWLETLKWLSGFAECYTKKPYNGGVGDDGTVAMARLMCVLMQDDTPEKLRDAKCYFQWFDDVLGVSNGTQGVIKADYSFYHHAMMLAGYWLTNMPQFCKVLMAFEGTPYANSQAWANVRQNLLVFDRMYRSETQPFNLRGRHFDDRDDYRILDMTRDMALHGNPATGEAVDSELAAAWLANRKDDMEIPKEFEPFAPEYDYHQVLNWAGVSTHSIENIFATVMGVNNNTMNWDAGEAREYSRYNRCGSMYLSRGTLTAEQNGYIDKGWDWSRLPGVTAPYLEHTKLKEATRNTGGYGDERSFAGGVDLLTNGVYAYRVSDQNNKAWNAQKSWFFFDDRIVCLGSNIQGDDARPMETTLFQLNMKDFSEAVQINGERITDFPFEKKINESTLKLVDTKGHGYYLPGGQTVHVRKQEQTTGDSFGEMNTGQFAVAWIDHGVAPKNGAYEYMIQLGKAVDQPEYEVLRKDSKAHVVRDLKTGMVCYVIFEATDDLPGPVTACSRPGLIMVQESKAGVQLSFCDPDLMTNPGGLITRYNMDDTLESPMREINLTLKGGLELKEGKGSIKVKSGTSKLSFSTNNAVVERLGLSR